MNIQYLFFIKLSLKQELKFSTQITSTTICWFIVLIFCNSKIFLYMKNKITTKIRQVLHVFTGMRFIIWLLIYIFIIYFLLNNKNHLPLLCWKMTIKIKDKFCVTTPLFNFRIRGIFFCSFFVYMIFSVFSLRRLSDLMIAE